MKREIYAIVMLERIPWGERYEHGVLYANKVDAEKKAEELTDEEWLAQVRTRLLIDTPEPDDKQQGAGI